MSIRRWIEASLVGAVAYQVVQMVASVVFLGPLYLARGQLWRSPGDRSLFLLPLVYLFIGFSLAYVYHRVRGVMAARGWRRGLRFGFWVWVVGSVPYHGARFVLMPIPGVLALGEGLTDLIAYMSLGMVFGWLLEPKEEAPGAASTGATACGGT